MKSILLCNQPLANEILNNNDKNIPIQYNKTIHITIERGALI